jgi:branched-chain amino acid transport system ATP-binding protein
MYFHGDGISLRFGGVTALSGVGFHVRRNSLQAIIGPNGAGKTSLFNVITGFYRMDAGEIHLDGNRISGLAPHLSPGSGSCGPSRTWRIFTT